LLSAGDAAFEDYLTKNHIVLLQVTRDVATYARSLLRTHPALKKPQDAIHLATAALASLEEFHTYDRANILPLDGKIACADSSMLLIKVPDDPPAPVINPQASIFDVMDC
jgi:hypothetical protein